MLSRLRAPVEDRRFRRLLILLGAWNLASNVAAPFLTVYLMQQLGYGLSVVTGLWVLSQLANVLTIYLWGRLSDRLSNKAILSVAFPVQIGAGLVAFAATVPVMALFFNGWTSFYSSALARTVGAFSAAGVR